jgi:hypothetical protein
LVNATPSMIFFMRHLPWDAAEVVELREEVTQAQAAVVMVRARTAQVEQMVVDVSYAAL